MSRSNPHWSSTHQPGGARTTTEPTLAAAVMRRVWLLETLHRITSTINQQDDVEESLPEIARVIFEQLGLVSVGIGVLEDGWIHYRGVASRISPVRNQIPLAGHHPEDESHQLTPHPLHAEHHGPARLSDIDAIDRSAKVPIRVNGDVYGVLSVAVSVDSRLTGEELEVLDQIAAALGSGIEQSRRRNAQLHRVARLSQLQDILTRINDHPEPRDATTDVLEDVVEAFGYAQVSLGLVAGRDLHIYNRYRKAFQQETPVGVLAISRGVGGRAARSGRAQIVPDVASDPDYVSMRDQTASMMCVPLWSGDEVIGVLRVESDVPQGLSESDLELASILADRFELVISSLHRTRTLERRAEQLHILERVTSTIGKMIPTRAAIVDVVSELHETWGYISTIGLIENDRLVFHGLDQGTSVPAPAWLREGLPLDRGITGRVARTGEPEFVREVEQDPDYLDCGASTEYEIAIPIKAERRVIGVLNVEAPREQPLDDEDFEILAIIANHLGIALSNYQVFASEQNARRALEAVQRVSTIVARALDPDEALRLIAETLAAVLSYPLVAVELLTDGHLRLAASFGFASGAHDRQPVESSVVGHVATTGETLFLADIASDPRARKLRDDVTSSIYVPIQAGLTLTGVLTVQGTSARELAEWDVDLLQTFAEHAGVLLDNARVYDEMRRTATIDSITGVANHRHFQQWLHQEMDRARKSDSDLSLLVIDIDTFKDINDRFGHVEGDRVLSEIAERMAGQLRSQDLLARYAGDEFVVVLPDVSSRVSLDIAARLLRSVRSRPFELAGGETAVVTLSIGAATFPEDATSVEDLISAADTAMYLAKGYGRDAVCHFRDIALLESGISPGPVTEVD